MLLRSRPTETKHPVSAEPFPQPWPGGRLTTHTQPVSSTAHRVALAVGAIARTRAVVVSKRPAENTSVFIFQSPKDQTVLIQNLSAHDKWSETSLHHRAEIDPPYAIIIGKRAPGT